MFESKHKVFLIRTAQRSEKYLNTVLDKIANAIGHQSQPPNYPELAEAVRLLVEERDQLLKQKEEAIRDRDFYRNAITKLVDLATKVSK